MYGCGNTKDLIPESLDILEEIAINYIHGLLYYSLNHFNNNKLTHKEILITLRKVIT